MRTLLVGRAGGAVAAAGVAAFLLGHGCAEAGATPSDRGHAASSDSPAGQRRDATAGSDRQKTDRRSRDDGSATRQNRQRATAQRPAPEDDASAPATASNAPRVTSPAVTDTPEPASLRTVAPSHCARLLASTAPPGKAVRRRHLRKLRRSGRCSPRRGGSSTGSRLENRHRRRRWRQHTLTNRPQPQRKSLSHRPTRTISRRSTPAGPRSSRKRSRSGWKPLERCCVPSAA